MPWSSPRRSTSAISARACAPFLIASAGPAYTRTGKKGSRARWLLAPVWPVAEEAGRRSVPSFWRRCLEMKTEVLRMTGQWLATLVAQEGMA